MKDHFDNNLPYNNSLIYNKNEENKYKLRNKQMYKIPLI